MSSTPAKKSAGDARYVSQDPFIHGNQRCPIQTRLQSVLGVCSSYVERNYMFRIYARFPLVTVNSLYIFLPQFTFNCCLLFYSLLHDLDVVNQ